jgi:4-hydroxy-2-oxoheptanedioate aldolase
VRAAIEDAFARINKTGKAAGFLSANHDDIRWVLDHGADFVAVGSDVALLTNMCRAHAADFKAHCEELDQGSGRV